MDMKKELFKKVIPSPLAGIKRGQLRSRQFRSEVRTRIRENTECV
jgi:hypothetical protein